MSKKVLIAFCDYIASNWNASLGWGNDKEVVKNACDDARWLLDCLELTDDEVYDFFRDNREGS